MSGIILEQVHEVLNVFAIVDRHDLVALLRVEDSLSEHESSNATEAVDSYFD